MPDPKPNAIKSDDGAADGDVAAIHEALARSHRDDSGVADGDADDGLLLFGLTEQQEIDGGTALPLFSERRLSHSTLRAVVAQDVLSSGEWVVWHEDWDAPREVVEFIGGAKDAAAERSSELDDARQHAAVEDAQQHAVGLERRLAEAQQHAAGLERRLEDKEAGWMREQERLGSQVCV